MTRLKHAVLIDQSLAQVYARCEQVERYPEFLPGYLESSIIARAGEKLLLKRAAQMRGRVYRWTSWVSFEKNKTIHFEQAEGPLRGMRVEWCFYPLSPSKTNVVITHDFHLTRPFGVAFFLERFFFKPRLDVIAGLVVAALKNVCERQSTEVVPV